MRLNKVLLRKIIIFKNKSMKADYIDLPQNIIEDHQKSRSFTGENWHKD